MFMAGLFIIAKTWKSLCTDEWIKMWYMYIIIVVVQSPSRVSLPPHELQHTRLPCLPLSPVVCSNSYPLCQWCYLTVSSSVAPFFFCLQSFPASETFPMSQLFESGGQSTGASSFRVSSMNIQGWFPLGWTGLIQGTLKSLLQHHNLRASILWCSAFLMVQLSLPHVTPGKTTALTVCTFVSIATSLLFNMLPRFVIAFLPRSKCLLIS